jgi:hypothetical protein
MPTFTFKDLMISFGPYKQPRACVCFGYSYQVTYQPLHVEQECTMQTFQQSVFCNLCQIIHTNRYACPVATQPQQPGSPTDPITLASLKAQLKEAIATIEQEENAAAELKSEAEVDELQGKIREALTELDKRREQLRNKSAK